MPAVSQSEFSKFGPKEDSTMAKVHIMPGVSIASHPGGLDKKETLVGL